MKGGGVAKVTLSADRSCGSLGRHGTSNHVVAPGDLDVCVSLSASHDYPPLVLTAFLPPPNLLTHKLADESASWSRLTENVSARNQNPPKHRQPC